MSVVEMDMVSIPDPNQKEPDVMAEHAILQNMQLEDSFFNDYIENMDISGKKDLINYVYKLKDNPEVTGLTESSTKTFIRAVLKFITSDVDRNFQNRLRIYMTEIQDKILR